VRCCRTAGYLYGAGAWGNIADHQKPDSKVFRYVEVEGPYGQLRRIHNSERLLNLPVLEDVLAVRINGYRDDVRLIKNTVLVGRKTRRDGTRRVAVRLDAGGETHRDAAYNIDKVDGGLNFAGDMLRSTIGATVRSQYDWT